MPSSAGTEALPARLLRGAALALAAWFAVALVWVVVHRLGYPYELEWMEGSMVDQVARVLEGKALYAAPTVDHVPYLYTPLYFLVSAPAAAVMGPGPPALRVVNLAAFLGTFALVGLAVRRESGSRSAGLLAAAVPLAGYGLVDSWYDLARNDGLFLLLVMLAAVLARWLPRRRLWLAGIAVALAFLAKQSALFLLPALCLGAAAVDLRRGVLLGVWSVLATGLTVGAAHLVTEGWFTFFVFEMPRGHGVNEQIAWFFTGWRRGIVTLYPGLLLGLAWVVGRWRRPGEGGVGGAAYWALLGLGLVVLAYLSRRHLGGHVNAFAPALLAAGVGTGLAAGSARGRLELAALAVVVVQLAVLLYEPGRFVPPAAHRRAHEELTRWVEQQPGDVVLLFHGDVTGRAGKARTVHAQALFDLLQYRDGRSEELGHFVASLDRAVAAGRFSAFVFDEKLEEWVVPMFERFLEPFERLDEPPIADLRRLQPVVGMGGAWPSAFFVRR